MYVCELFGKSWWFFLCYTKRADMQLNFQLIYLWSITVFRLWTWSEGRCRLHSHQITTQERKSLSSSRKRRKGSTSWHTSKSVESCGLAWGSSWPRLDSSSVSRSGSSHGTWWSRSPSSQPPQGCWLAMPTSSSPQGTRHTKTSWRGCLSRGGESFAWSMVSTWRSTWSCRNIASALWKAIILKGMTRNTWAEVSQLFLDADSVLSSFRKSDRLHSLILSLYYQSDIFTETSCRLTD